MKMFKFGKSSKKHLDSVDPKLALAAHKALSYSVMDFSVVQGKRTLEEQKALYAQGRTVI